MNETRNPLPRNLWGHRAGRLLQIAGLVIGLEALLVFGSEPSEGPMIYVTFAALAVFYAGTMLVRRFGPPGQNMRK